MAEGFAAGCAVPEGLKGGYYWEGVGWGDEVEDFHSDSLLAVKMRLWMGMVRGRYTHLAVSSMMHRHRRELGPFRRRWGCSLCALGE